LKVTAVLNQMAGLKSTGSTYAGVPTIFGMNFQAVSVGQKLATGNTKDPQDSGLVGGYADAVGAQPNNGLASGLDFVDTQLQSMLDALEKNHLREDTLIIVSAKHGQSPINLAQRTAVDDSPYTKTPGFAASITDDVGLVWLAPDAQKTQYEAAETYLKSQFGPLGITKLLDRDDLKKLYQDPFSDNRTPDFIAITKQGQIYTGGTKLAEHGGFAKDDRNVALLVSKPSMEQSSVDDVVETKQIAPTILKVLGIDPSRLNAVKLEKTVALPGLDHRDSDHQDNDHAE
jgi:arylsulfatase A-like enzyme